MIEIPTITELLQKVKKFKDVQSYDSAVNAISYWRRHISLCEIDSEVAEGIEGMIRFWNTLDEENGLSVDERSPIILYINSPGGDLNATFTIIDAIRISITPIWTVNIGMAYSGGFFTFIAGHKRYAYPHSSFLLHEGGTEMGGDANKFQNFSAFYKAQLEELKKIVLHYTKMAPEFYEEIKRDDFWMSADKAIELGCADEIIKRIIF